MSWEFSVLKWIHILSSTVLFGTGAGIAFFFVRAHRTQDVGVIAAVSRDVVVADGIFTATAVVVQPLTGLSMIWLAGYPWNQAWIVLSIALYLIVGCCWLPVVWLQIRMRDMALAALTSQARLPAAYRRYYRSWFALGWPAFLGVLVIFYLMVARPTLWTR